MLYNVNGTIIILIYDVIVHSNKSSISTEACLFQFLIAFFIGSKQYLNSKIKQHIIDSETLLTPDIRGESFHFLTRPP